MLKPFSFQGYVENVIWDVKCAVAKDDTSKAWEKNLCTRQALDLDLGLNILQVFKQNRGELAMKKC